MSRQTSGWAALAVAFGLALGSSGSSKAQQVVFSQPMGFSGAGGALSAPMSAGGIVQGSGYSSEPLFPYSYYAAYPSPAREYVPYGQNDLFPFDGRAYGHPYDRFSWTYLAGYNDLLNRYYYPPVR